MDVWMDIWTSGCLDVWMDEWMDGWMDGSIYPSKQPHRACCTNEEHIIVSPPVRSEIVLDNFWIIRSGDTCQPSLTWWQCRTFMP
jgi:hypothetical protein